MSRNEDAEKAAGTEGKSERRADDLESCNEESRQVLLSGLVDSLPNDPLERLASISNIYRRLNHTSRRVFEAHQLIARDVELVVISGPHFIPAGVQARRSARR